MIIDPCAESPRNVYKVMIGTIVPRPIAFVSTLSADGIRNLAPFSFFTAISANPPVICFSPMIRGSGSGRKDTLRNIEATREFVVNIVSEDFVQQMNTCSGEYPPEVDEFEVSGLTPVFSDMVRPARVKEARVNMECKLVQVVHVSERPLGGSIVLGEVLRFHLDDTIVEDFRIDPDKLSAVGRMGGATYVRTTDRFDLVRPK
ncbi:MAG: flavin reductase family protein [Bryobacteraceae bacterium]|nr:flavin reductase family protein [Bryobacterales bacterium]MEB2362304.1 flavin reductase family protein [Bryobacterales bacterium]NUN03664.1 flavin reductase family protein [Bryobacteraceae bacterium]